MHKHKKPILIALGCIILIVFFASVFLLWRKIADYKKADNDLQSVLAEQSRLLIHNPYPSPENIAQEKDNLELIRLEFAELSETMRNGQVEPVQQAPAAFNAMFWKIKGELMAQAREKGVTIPADFAFGFLRHMTGFLPDHPDVPRLTQQLTIVQELCKVLYEARITNLRDLFREEFEGGGPASAGPGKVVAIGSQSTGATANQFVKDAGVIPDGGLFGKMHFTLRFTAHEAAFRDVLNRLADHRMFVIVTRIELESGETTIVKHTAVTGSEPQALDETGAPVKANLKELSREDRIVCGNRDTPVAVTLEIDVYRFRPVVEPVKQS